LDENRVKGTARNLGGKAEEAWGNVTGDARTQAEGAINQAAGAAQDVYGQTVDATRETASSFEKTLRRTMKPNPIPASSLLSA
jgi:uncharacterized protein YjbJ (UPF0337 family)